MRRLRDVWEETSFRLERRQANVQCVEQEQRELKQRTNPEWKLTFDPNNSAIRSIGTFILTQFSSHFLSRSAFMNCRKDS